MKFTRQWVQEEFLDLSGLSDADLERACRKRGLPVTCREGMIEINSRRPDLGSILGFAREAAAILGRPLIFRSSGPEERKSGSVYDFLDVDVFSDNCLRLTVRMAADCRNGPSPGFLQHRLTASGIKPQSVLTDIAAAVSLELGEHVQILDFRQVPEGSLMLRDSFAGEAVPGPEGTLRMLPEGSPLYASCSGSALAPALTENKGLPEDCTQAVILCGSFSREILSAHGPLPCSLDPMGTLAAVNRTGWLMEQLHAGILLEGTLDNLNYVPFPRTLDLCLKDAEKELLKPLGFSFSQGQVTLPSWRVDLTDEDDLQKELQRISPQISDKTWEKP